jgi:hypothetical protein
LFERDAAPVLGASILEALRRVIEYPGQSRAPRIAEIIVEIALELLIYFDCNLENLLKDNTTLLGSDPTQISRYSGRMSLKET